MATMGCRCLPRHGLCTGHTGRIISMAICCFRLIEEAYRQYPRTLDKRSGFVTAMNSLKPRVIFQESRAVVGGKILCHRGNGGICRFNARLSKLSATFPAADGVPTAGVELSGSLAWCHTFGHERPVAPTTGQSFGQLQIEPAGHAAFLRYQLLAKAGIGWPGRSWTRYEPWDPAQVGCRRLS